MHAATAGRLEDQTTEVNISPLIDLVFILLIFFIVTTVFVEEDGLQVAAPVAETIPDRPTVVLRLVVDGGIIHEGNVVTPESVTAIVHRQMTTDPAAVVLEFEPGVAAQRVVTVIDSAHLGGARDVSLTSLP